MLAQGNPRENAQAARPSLKINQKKAQQVAKMVIDQIEAANVKFI